MQMLSMTNPVSAVAAFLSAGLGRNYTEVQTLFNETAARLMQQVAQPSDDMQLQLQPQGTVWDVAPWNNFTARAKGIDLLGLPSRRDVSAGARYHDLLPWEVPWRSTAERSATPRRVLCVLCAGLHRHDAAAQAGVHPRPPALPAGVPGAARGGARLHQRHAGPQRDAELTSARVALLPARPLLAASQPDKGGEGSAGGRGARHQGMARSSSSSSSCSRCGALAGWGACLRRSCRRCGRARVRGWVCVGRGRRPNSVCSLLRCPGFALPSVVSAAGPATGQVQNRPAPPQACHQRPHATFPHCTCCEATYNATHTRRCCPPHGVPACSLRSMRSSGAWWSAPGPGRPC